MMTQEFSQYQEMLSRLAARALGAGDLAGKHSHEGAEGTPMSVSLAVPAARLLLGDDHTLYPALAKGIQRLAQVGQTAIKAGGSGPPVIDEAGHSREIYGALVLYLHLAAFSQRYETLPSDLWGICEDRLPEAVAPARWIEGLTGTPPDPPKVSMALWAALCLLRHAMLAGRDVDVELAEAVVHQIINRPGPGGSLHPLEDPASNSGTASIDTWTYHELCGLHALASLAVIRRHAAWAKRVEQVAMYHLEHTQPDHTTTQPWGVFAFLWSPKTRSFGEQQIHDATAHSGGLGLGTIAGMLLADAAVWLAAFEQ